MVSSEWLFRPSELPITRQGVDRQQSPHSSHIELKYQGLLHAIEDIQIYYNEPINDPKRPPEPAAANQEFSRNLAPCST